LFSDDVGYWETHQEGDGEIMEAISFLLHDEGRPNGGAGVNNADIDYQDIKVEPIKCDFATKKKMKIEPKAPMRRPKFLQLATYSPACEEPEIAPSPLGSPMSSGSSTQYSLPSTPSCSSSSPNTPRSSPPTPAKFSGYVYSPQGVAMNPKNFVHVCSLLGAEVVPNSFGGTQVRLATPFTPLYTPITMKLGAVENHQTYVMSGNIPPRIRRRHDIFNGFMLNNNERACWCDQGNAHCVLDVSKPLREVSSSGMSINPRRIQVAHALASRVSNVTSFEKPVIKCFYVSLKSKQVKKRKPNTSGTYTGMSLGLHKHIYVLCDQSIDSRHNVMEGSAVWLVRYFVKGDLHESLKPYVDLSTTPKKLNSYGSASSIMSLD